LIKEELFSGDSAGCETAGIAKVRIAHRGFV